MQGRMKRWPILVGPVARPPWTRVEVECSSGQASRKGTSSSTLDLIGVLDVGVD